MRHLLLITLCGTVFASVLSAQSDRGTITGTVTDPAGGVVAGASVEAKQLDTNALFPTTTTQTGNYTLVQLPAGAYEVTASAPGFKKFVRTGITVQVAQTVRVDIALVIGAASESVSVSAEAGLLQTESGDVSHNVSVNTLDELPMLGVGSASSGSSGIRNPDAIVNVIPGAYYVPNADVKINGAPANSYSYHIEGMDSTAVGYPYAGAQTQPSVDAIQEIAVQTSNFAPEYGAVGGGFFNVTIRSGTNQYHGTAYDYIVNEITNAGEPFSYINIPVHPNELLRPRARRTDYGWTIGGPASIPKLYNGKDKSFFFFNFEQYRETQFFNFSDTVPTNAYRNGNFSGAITAGGNAQLKGPGGITTDVLGNPLIANVIYDVGNASNLNGQRVANPFPNNTVPFSRMDPVALKIQALIPLPTNGNTLNNYLVTEPAITHTTIPAIKFDQLIGSKLKISYYWSFTHTDTPASCSDPTGVCGGASPFFGGYEGFPNPISEARGSFIHSYINRLNFDYTVSPTFLLHVGLGYQQNNFFDDAPVLNYNAQEALGLTGATLNRNFPRINGLCQAAAVCGAAGGMYAIGPGGQSHTFWEKPAGNVSGTWVKQNHTFKGGFEMYWEAVPNIPYTATAGAYTFSANETTQPYLVGTTLSGGTLGFPYASFLLGAVDSYTVAAPAVSRQANKQLGIFLQDSWKLSRKLTIDYGLRWDYGTYFREEHGRGINFSPTTPNPSAGGQPGAYIFEGSAPGHCDCNFAKNYPYAIGPRIGGAYSMNDKTVLRAGWGLVYSQVGVTTTGINQAPIVATANGSSPGLGVPVTTLAQGLPPTPPWPVISPGVSPSLPTGNQTAAAGLLDPSVGRPARQNQWSIGIQRQLGSGIALDVSYVGNRGVWWGAPSLVDLNGITPQILAAHGLNLASPADQSLLLSTLSSSTAAARGFNIPPYAGFSTSNTVAQALRPFPQFGNIGVSGPPLGKTWYDSLQTKLTKRLSHGLTINGTFSWQKTLATGNDANTNLTYVNNVFEGAQQSKSISAFDQPLLLKIWGSYTIPRITALGKASYILQDWTVGTLLGYSSGLPIPVAVATTSINSQVFDQSLMNRVPGVPLYLVPNLNCHCYDPSSTPLLNPAAWANPAPGTFASGAPFYSDYRYQRHPSENINLGRTWRIKERVSLNLRIEFENFLNRTYINNPTSTNPTTPVTKNSQGILTGGFGYVNTAFSATTLLAQPRNGTMIARITF